MYISAKIYSLAQSSTTMAPKGLSVQYVLERLTFPSEYRQQAFIAGMIRPFLFLVSMPPHSRFEVSKLLNISLTSAEYSGSPEKESWKIISDDKRGLQSRIDGILDSLLSERPVSNWYECLQRTFKFCFKDTACPFPSMEYMDSMKLCQTSKTQIFLQFELIFLNRIAQAHFSRFPNEIREKITDYLRNPENQPFINNLIKHGIRNEALQSYVIAMAFLFSQSGDPEANLKEQSATIQDPRTKTDKNKRVAKKVGTTALKVAVNSLIIMPLSPVAGVAFVGYQVTSAIFGSKPNSIFAALVQILLHKLVLIVSDISIDDYY
eukprot:TRINITY_DN659_c0_g1_i8.p1 TRINITY_DN659_c0_g1~~TRINITY_DN659_c0_g1_i8.p1  ORF type:complete len:321 (-),score=126.54 TRINITY_DN659_c0_g1_i8:170-1132(-)